MMQKHNAVEEMHAGMPPSDVGPRKGRYELSRGQSYSNTKWCPQVSNSRQVKEGLKGHPWASPVGSEPET